MKHYLILLGYIAAPVTAYTPVTAATASYASCREKQMDYLTKLFSE